MTAVIMPRQGQSVESCIITSLAKKEGDTVSVGDLLFSYETDKSAFDEMSAVSGKILKIFYAEGDDVPCLENVLVIGEEGEDISVFAPTASADTVKEETAASPVEAVKSVAKSAVVPVDPANMKISPRAKNLAAQSKADLSKAEPTGPNGRIIERDVLTLLDKGFRTGRDNIITPVQAEAKSSDTATPVLPAEYEDVKHTNVRKVIAKAMHSSLSTMAQLTLNSSFDATQILKFRADLKTSGEKLGLENITLNDIVLYATAKTLLNHKDVNANYFDDYMRYFNVVNLGIAVDTDRGLLVPVLFNAEKLSLNELSKAAKALISDAKKGIVPPDNLKGGSFTVTNLGSLGVESFTPVINPPQTCILGVNNITKRVKDVNGEIKMYDCMALSLTFDHRAIDGAPAARFLAELCASLENFYLLLAK